MTAAEQMHAFLDHFSRSHSSPIPARPQFVNLFRATSQWPFPTISGAQDVAIEYPSAVVGVDVPNDIYDRWTGNGESYIRSALSGALVYPVTIRYADGARAEARFYTARERDELATVMRAMQSAATETA